MPNVGETIIRSRFTNIAAGISVTRAGAASSMAAIVEIEEYLSRTAKQ